MKKVLFLILIVIGLSFHAAAQKNSIRLGISYGIGLSNIANHTVLDKRYNTVLSQNIGFDLSYQLNEKLSLSTQVMVDARGGKFMGNGREILGRFPNYYLGDTIRLQDENMFAYFTFPLQLDYKLKLNNKLNLDIGFGGYYAYLIKQVYDFEIGSVPITIEANTLQFDYNTNDFGLIGSLGLNYKISTKISINGSINYLRGLTSMLENNEEIAAYHQRIYAEVGVNTILKR